MSTSVIQPPWGNATLWRDIIRRNRPLAYVEIVVDTSRTWLPHLLTDLGVFPSGSEVKRNRPDLWCNYDPFEIINLGWARIINALTGSGK